MTHQPHYRHSKILVAYLLTLSLSSFSCGDTPTAPTPVVAANGQIQEDCDGMLEAYNLKRVGSYDGAGEAFHHWSDAGVSASHRNDTWIAIASEPPVEDVEYISFFATGQQNALEVGKGFRATATGQFNKWRNAINTGGPDDDINTCKYGMLGRTKYDPGYQFPGESFLTKRNPVDRTFAAASFDTQLQWGAGEWDQIRDAFYQWLKSKADPARLKGIYLVGSSRAGCLGMMLASKFQNETSDGGLWKKVPIIIQGFDPVCNPNHAGEMGVSSSTRDNPLHPGDDPGGYINTSDYFAYKSSTFGSYFPQTNKVAINSVIGGASVISVSNARAMAYLDDDGDIYNGSLAWYRQRWVDMTHPQIGRSWHHTITLDAMNWWRSNYNYFDMWGTQVYFPYSESEYNETGGGHTVNVPISAHYNVHDRDLGVFIEVLPSSTATYGVDYTIAGATSLPSSIMVTIPAHTFAESLPVQILYSAGVEPDEFIDLRIGEHPILGKAGLYGSSKDHRITIIDRDTTPYTQETCEAAGGLWDPVSEMCGFKSVQYIEEICLGDAGGWDDDTGVCILDGEPVRPNNCVEPTGAWSWSTTSEHCLLEQRDGSPSEVECVANKGRFHEASGRCEKMPQSLDADRCAALDPELGIDAWDQDRHLCSVRGLAYNADRCAYAKGQWDGDLQTCMLARARGLESIVEQE